MNNSITIAITSCGRLSLLKKTIESLTISYDISKYKKLLSEDIRDKNKIKKVKELQQNGFLKGWDIIFTGGIGDTNSQKHFNALKCLYRKIDTPYVFHCEDDWFFKKTSYNFIEISKKILDTHKNIGLIQLRDFDKDGGYNHLKLTKKERKNQLFKQDIKELHGHIFLEFRNDPEGDSCMGFSLNPGLRRISEMKRIMFGSNEVEVNEENFGKVMKKMGLIGINLKNGITYHIGNSFMSTKIIEQGLTQGIKKIIQGFYNYRIKTVIVKFLYKGEKK